MRSPRVGAAAGVFALTLFAAASFPGWQAGARGDAPPPAPAIEEVRRAYAQCREIRKQATPIDLHQRRSGTPAVRSWQREPPPEAEKTGRTMTLFTAGGAVRTALEEMDAPSGDWRQTTEHCFRPDGSVAFVLAVLRTLQGNVQVEDRLYFNPRGESIRTLRNVSDLATKKPLKPDEASFMGRKPQLYRNADELLRAVGPQLVFPSPSSK